MLTTLTLSNSIICLLPNSVDFKVSLSVVINPMCLCASVMLCMHIV